MSPATMYGKILFKDMLDPNENRFNHEYFDRSIWFMEDMHSLHWIDFCSRYFGMPDYERMYDLVQLYFHTVRLPIKGLRSYDLMTHKRIMYHVVDNTQKRKLYSLVDNTKKRKLYTVVEEMPQMKIGGGSKNANPSIGSNSSK